MLFAGGRFCRLILGCAFALFAVPALGCYSGLAIIPTAETVGAGNYGLELQMDGANLDSDETVRILNTQVGIGERCEAGVDFDLSKEADSRALINAKYIFAVDGRSNTSFALGTFNVASRFKHSPYIVATHDRSAYRLHFGGMRTEGNNRWFTGADFGMGERWTVMSDYTSGDENYSSLGFNYQFNEGFGIMGGAMFPNSDGDTLFTMHFCFGGAMLGGI